MIYLFLLAAFLWEGSAPGGFKAKVTIPKTEINLEEPLVVKLSYETPPGYVPDLKEFREHLLLGGPFQDSPFRLQSEKRSEGNVLYELEAQRSGTFPVSFFTMPFKSTGGETKHLFSEVAEITVTPYPLPQGFQGLVQPLASLTPRIPISLDSQNMENITSFDPDEFKAEFNQRTFPWLAVLFLILTALGAVFLLKIFEGWKAIPATPEEIKANALKQLSKLKTKAPTPEAYFLQASDVLKNYLKARTGINVPSMTTQEILSHLQELQGSEMARLLSQADLIKFAGMSAKEEDEEAFYNAIASPQSHLRAHL